jgi:SNF2 family DNA or RNA helicase
MQSIAVMEFLRTKARSRDPMLVVAPLTTLEHWRREIETWTAMNVVCYMGGREDREVRRRCACMRVWVNVV